MADPGYGEIRRKILAAMMIVPGVPLVLVLMVGYYYFHESLKSETIAKMEKIVEGHKKSIEAFLQERTDDLKQMVNAYEFSYLSQPDNLAQVFGALADLHSGFMDIGVFNSDGVHVAYIGPYQLVGIIYRDTIWFKEVMHKEIYISDSFMGFRKEPHFVIAVSKRNGESTWVLRATIDTLLFNQTVENVRIGQTGEAYIVNKKGYLQTKRRSGGELMQEDIEAKHYLTPHEGISTFLGSGPRGDTYLYATTWLKKGDWMLVVRQKREEVFQELSSASYLVLGVLLIGGLMILSAALYATNRIVDRLRQMDEDKIQLGRQLIAAERLAQIGEMSAGVAHEINNPLQIIEMERTLIEVSLNDLLETIDLPPSDELDQIRDSLNQIRVQVGRGAEITQGLLKFARKKDQVTKMVGLRSLVSEIIDLVKRKAGVEGITISEDVAPDLPAVKLDPSQFQQVILNLLNNAIDAVTRHRGSSGGMISIKIAPVGQFVGVAVTDNGTGISHENLRKVFTPFFTTKPVGQGTGLGLAVCYGIISQMGGTIEVDSELGRGTTFLIRLPIPESVSEESRRPGS